MKRYFKMLVIFYKNAVMNEMEYRLNFWSSGALNIFWLLWAAMSVKVYFLHTDTVSGWNYYQLLIVMGLFFTMNGFRQFLLVPNLGRMTEYIRLGTLDHLLTKPVNSQFMVSFRYYGMFHWFDAILGFGLMCYALKRLNHMPGIEEILMFLVLLGIGMVLLYSIYLLLQTTTIWLVDMDGLDTIIQGLIDTARFPVSFYSGIIRLFLTAVIPVAFATTFPAEAILGRLGWDFVLLALIFSAVMLVLSSLFWRFAVRHYTGASS